MQTIDHLEVADSIDEALSDADAVIVLTEWQEIKEIDWASKKPLLNSPVLVDFRNLYEPETMSKLGYHYASLGRPVIAAWHG